MLTKRKEASASRARLSGIAAGLAYAYMVWTWGGFIFVGNMVAVHAAVITALGYFSSTLHIAYSCFFIVGTSLAVQVPVVGWSLI